MTTTVEFFRTEAEVYIDDKEIIVMVMEEIYQGGRFGCMMS